MNAARLRGIAAMKDPEAGLVFMTPPRQQRYPQLTGIFLPAICLVLLLGLPFLSSHMTFLLVLGVALFRLTAMEAVG